MVELASQSILHALVAALVAEALLKVWRVRDPGQRLEYRLLTLAVPVVLLPLLAGFAPFRTSEAFRDRFALFSSERWSEVRIGPLGLDTAALAAAAAVGLALFLRDLLPLLLESFGRRGAAGALPADRADELLSTLGDLAKRMGIPAPRVRFLDDRSPLLSCRGLLRPTVVVSRGALVRLERAELVSALAHELAHAARRDPLRGWLLLAVRAILFFNPVVQVIARAAVQEMERLADDTAAAVTGKRLALAAGLVTLFSAGEGDAGAVPAGLRGSHPVARFARHAASAAIEKRARRLIREPAPDAVSYGGLRIALTGLGISGLVFFVV